MEAITRMQPAGKGPNDTLRIVRPPDEEGGFTLAPKPGEPARPSVAPDPDHAPGVPGQTGEPLPDPAQAEASKAQDRGLVCRKCGCRHFRVYYTRPMPDGSVFRRRVCMNRHCEHKMSTRERPM